MDWIYHLDLDHVLMLNEISTTYYLWLYKKIDILVKVVTDIEYIRGYANDHIEREYCVHVLKEEVITPSSSPTFLQSIPKSASTSLASVSATATVPTPSIIEDPASIADSSEMEYLVAALLSETMKTSQEA